MISFRVFISRNAKILVEAILLLAVGWFCIPKMGCADSCRSTVQVSVQVVRSCLVDVTGSQTGATVALNMLCNSDFKPAVQLTGTSPSQPAFTVTGVRMANMVNFIAVTPGSVQPILHIDF